MDNAASEKAAARARDAEICRASARAWRAEAECLREMAARPSIAPHIAAAHLRSATSADEQADWWEAGLAADLAAWANDPA